MHVRLFFRFKCDKKAINKMRLNLNVPIIHNFVLFCRIKSKNVDNSKVRKYGKVKAVEGLL